MNPGKTEYVSFICEILKKKLTSKTCSKRNLLQSRLTAQGAISRKPLE